MALDQIEQAPILTYKHSILDVAGRKIVGVKGATWKHELQKAPEYGTSPVQVGEAIGNYSASGDIDLLIFWYDKLMSTLGTGYGGGKFSVLQQYIEPATGYTWRVQLPGCSITSEEIGNNDSDGGKGTSMKVAFNITKPVMINGRSILRYRFADGGPIVRAVASAALQLFGA